MLNSFYEAVLPRSGQLCLFLLTSKQHVWADSLDSLIEQTEARSEQQGIYFGTASFKEPTARSQTNVLALRSLRIDIDAGEKKFAKAPDGAYPTQQDALVAFIGFSKAAQLPPSYIISSGEGLHIYYVLDADLPPESWLPLATRLGELGAQRGLKIDTTCTTDTARILRPPGTLHPNGKRVSILMANGKVYSADEIAAVMGPSAITKPARVFDMSVNEDIAVPSTPKSLQKILDNCPAMSEVAGSRGDVAEPHWRAMLGIIKFTVEGVEGAHELSSGHPDYDHDQTEAKFDAWSTGPTSCKEFSRHTKACSTCTHQGKVKSPIMVGMMTPDQIAELPVEMQPAAPVVAPPTGDAWDGFLPAGFSVTAPAADGSLKMVYATQVMKKDETGSSVMVPINVPFSDDVFWLMHWSEAAHDDDKAQAVMCSWDAKKQTVRAYSMDQSLTASRVKLVEYLGNKNIQLTSHTKAGAAVEDYIKAQLRRIKLLSRRPKISDRFGLRILPDGQLVCAQGKYVIFPSGEISEGILSKPLRDRCDDYPITAIPDGEGEDWPATVWDDHIRPAARKHVEFMKTYFGTPGLRKFQLVMMLGLASPMMAFATGSYHSGIKLPPNGLSVSLFSRGGGKGKTSLVQALMLAFGNPSELVKTSDASGSTDIARIAKLSLAGTLPMSMEELGNAKEISIAALISAVANGSGRQRGTKEGSFTTAQTWALINLITTNRSQRDMVAATASESNAIQYRLLEMNVNDVVYEQAARDAYAAAWSDVQRDCAGALGAVLHYAVCRMGAVQMNALVLSCVSKASKLLSAEQDARFQYRALGALMVVHTLLAQENMVMFDLKEMVDEFREAHNAGVAFAKENVLPTDGLELMQMMLSDLKPGTLITDSESHRGHDKSKFDIPLNTRVPDVVTARHVASMGWTYISSTAVRDWCIEKKVGMRDLLDDCKNAGVLIPPYRSRPNNFTIQVDLFKGTKEESAVVSRCIKVNTRQLRAMTGSDWDDTAGVANVLPLSPKTRPTGPAGPVVEGASAV